MNQLMCTKGAYRNTGWKYISNKKGKNTLKKVQKIIKEAKIFANQMRTKKISNTTNPTR